MRKFGIWICVCVLIMIALAWHTFLYTPQKRKVALENIVKYFPFTSENALKEWEEKVLKGKVQYSVEQFGDENAYVKAESKKTASALFYKSKIDIQKRPIISWKWRVEEFPKKKLPESISSKKEEDFAARIYVIFPAAFFTKSKVIEYIWSENIPAGTFGSSGYSENIKVLVLRSGSAGSEWFEETRNVYEDYLKLFGSKPSYNIGAIAFMTDSDSTKTEAGSLYDDIKISYKGE